MRQANDATIGINVVISGQQRRDVVGNDNDNGVKTNAPIAAIVKLPRTTAWYMQIWGYYRVWQIMVCGDEDDGKRGGRRTYYRRREEGAGMNTNTLLTVTTTTLKQQRRQGHCHSTGRPICPSSNITTTRVPMAAPL